MRTDKTKRIVAFRNFANAPKKGQKLQISYLPICYDLGFQGIEILCYRLVNCDTV
jgi:hypothetical protein